MCRCVMPYNTDLTKLHGQRLGMVLSHLSNNIATTPNPRNSMHTGFGASFNPQPQNVY